MIFEKLLQSTGKTVLSTVAQLAGAITNIVLDPILIYGLFGLPEMGIKGAAYATVIGQILTTVLGIVFHVKFNKEIKTSLKYIKPEKNIIKGIYKVGIPAIIIQALMSVMTYGLNIILGTISQSAVTAYGIYYKIQQFVFFAAFGMNNTIIPVKAYNYGMGSKKRVNEGIKYGMLYTLILMLLGMLGLQLFAHQICSAFSLSAETEKLCIISIRIISLGYLFAGANIAYQGIFQALGFGIKSLVISLVRLLIVVLPCAWILTLLAGAEKLVWAAVPFAEFIGLIVSLIFMRSTKKDMQLQ